MNNAPVKVIMKTFDIQYDIPPMRGIFYCEADAQSEEQARELLAELEPGRRIRKITERIDGDTE